MVERRGGSLNKEVEWRPWYGGTQGAEVWIKTWNGDHGMVERRGGSLNKEVECRALYGGTQGGEVLIKK